jgi:uncharacterized protein (DUF1697 family)
MTYQYLVLLRGINVGGNSLIKMAELKIALERDGFKEVKTYIQSGNVLVKTNEYNSDKVAKIAEKSINKHFNINARVAIFTKDEWETVISKAPNWWGKDKEWKHNLLIMLKPYNMDEVVEAIGELKPDIEAMEPGHGVLYQSMSLKLFGRTTTGKLASSPIYKQMTIRNYNTANKLLALFG